MIFLNKAKSLIEEIKIINTILFDKKNANPSEIVDLNLQLVSHPDFASSAQVQEIKRELQHFFHMYNTAEIENKENIESGTHHITQSLSPVTNKKVEENENSKDEITLGT